MTISEHYKAHIDLLEAMAEAGDEVAVKSLACLALLAEGWRYGDPDPDDGGGPDDDGGLPLPTNVIPFRLAA